MAAPSLDLNNHNDKQEEFKKSLNLSFGIHALILSFFILKLVFFSEPKIDLSQAIRVDMVGLPDKIKPGELPPKIENILKEQATPAEAEKKEDSKKPEPAPKTEKTKELPAKEPKADPNTINLDKTKAKQKSALDKLKSISSVDKKSALDKIRNQVREETYEKAKAESLQRQQQALIKGRVISAGTSLTGIDRLQSDSYLAQLDARIKANWSLPQWLMNRPYKTRVLVKFSKDGRIISQNIILSSGNPSYDEYCLQAIKEAEPFPPVPEKFTEKYSADGIVVGFPD